ncbi:hypothetical protein QZH41_005221 [Actinostola sp. cb2023]|nr:hypothetical protein QZH41_005221 [Actinostola sp. cb2023]
MGETRFELSRNHHKFLFEGLVVENLDVEVLAGTPFTECNDIAIRPAKRGITLKYGTTVLYGSRNTSIETCLPRPDAEYALEPPLDSPCARATTAYEPWPEPNIISSVVGKICLPNLSGHPQTLKRNEHFGQVSPVFELNQNEGSPPITPKTSPASLHTSVGKHSDKVQLDPDNLLSHDIKSKFRTLLEQYDCVFDHAIKGYNGSAGPLKARVNMGPVEPPQRKGRLPQYRNKLVELQQKFDDLEATGVFRRPEDDGVDVEYLNPSFFVSKRSGGSRLLGRYSKPQPSLMPNVDTTLRLIAQWNHIIKSDLISAFYQIPLARESMKYCGVATPFKGIRVHTHVQQCPALKWPLKNSVCRVLGELLQRGVVAKIADDLYCGGSNPTSATTPRRQHEVLEGLKGVHDIADDILITGQGETEEEAQQDYERNLIALLERCREVNLKLNLKKLKLRLPEVPYIHKAIDSSTKTSSRNAPSSTEVQPELATEKLMSYPKRQPRQLSHEIGRSAGRTASYGKEKHDRQPEWGLVAVEAVVAVVKQRVLDGIKLIWPMLPYLQCKMCTVEPRYNGHPGITDTLV